VIMAISADTMSISEVIASTMWEDNIGLKATVAFLIAIAAFTKSAQFPFQAWLPDSMVAIAPVSAYLHAAAMVKAGIYLILRYSPLLHDVQLWNGMLVVAGGFTALVGVLPDLKCDDLKELVAYSTSSLFDVVVLLVGIDIGVAVYHVDHHHLRCIDGRYPIATGLCLQRRPHYSRTGIRFGTAIYHSCHRGDRHYLDVHLRLLLPLYHRLPRCDQALDRRSRVP